MRKQLIYFFLLIGPLAANAQDNARDGRWFATFLPAITPMPGHAAFGVQPGLLVRVSPRLAFLSEITFSAGRRSEADSSFSDRRYLRIKPGLRYYFRDTSSTFNGYVGLEFSYSTRKFTSRNDFYYAHLPGDSVVYYDRARVNSPIITTSAQLGVVIAVNRRLKMDWFMGAGVRSIRTSYSELLNPVIGERSRERGGIQVHLPLSSYYIEGNVVRLQVTVGVRILYALPIHEKASI